MYEFPEVSPLATPQFRITPIGVTESVCKDKDETATVVPPLYNCQFDGALFENTKLFAVRMVTGNCVMVQNEVAEIPTAVEYPAYPVVAPTVAAVGDVS